MDLMKTGKLIKEARKAKRLTQEDIANKLNITSKSVSKWERGINFPDSAILPELGHILGLTTDELIEGKRKQKYKSFKKKIFIILIILGVLINFSIIGILSYSTYRNYNKSRLYKISSENNEFLISGYLTINYDYSVLIIDNITYQGKMLGKIKESNFQITDIILESNNSYYHDYVSDDENIELNNNFPSKSFIIENEYYDLDETYLIIKFNDVEGVIKLKFSEIFTNNKLFN